MRMIMVSYRREDSKWIAGRIFDRLESHYGKDNVFMDIDAIPIGLDFREHLQDSLQRCDILLAIVGPRWLGTDEHGHQAIAEASDWVRIEIEAALEKKIPVIPVLIDGVKMPKASELPETLRNFAFRQAAEVDSGVDFRTHMERLIRSMDLYLQGRSGIVSANTTVARDAQPDRGQIASAEPFEHREPISRVLSQAGRAALRHARFALSSWIVIGSILFGSELIGLLSERLVENNDSLLLIVLAPLGVIGLILIGMRLFEYLKTSLYKAEIARATLVLGVLAVMSVPSFFHVTRRPDQHALAVAWPLVLLGGFGLILIVTVMISHLSDANRRSRYVRAWIGFAIILLAFAWLDSDPTSTYLPMLGWRVRSVVIFTCVIISSAILAVIIAWGLIQIAQKMKPA